MKTPRDEVKEHVFEIYKETVLMETGVLPETLRDDFEEWWESL